VCEYRGAVRVGFELVVHERGEQGRPVLREVRGRFPNAAAMAWISSTVGAFWLLRIRAMLPRDRFVMRHSWVTVLVPARARSALGNGRTV
jgi:hypothetical protein